MVVTESTIYKVLGIHCYSGIILSPPTQSLSPGVTHPTKYQTIKLEPKTA